MLTEKEINEQVNQIIEKGFTPKKSTPHELFSFVKSIGIRNLFIGSGDIFFFILFSLIAALLFGFGNVERNSIFAIIHTISPILYFLLFMISILKDKTANTFDIIMSCKYTLRHFIGIKMLCFAIAALLINAILSLLFDLRYDIGFLKCFALSASSLFVFSALLILILLKSTKLRSTFILIVLWITIGVFAIANPIANELLADLPVLVYGLVALLTLLLSGFLLKAFMRERKELCY